MESRGYGGGGGRGRQQDRNDFRGGGGGRERSDRGGGGFQGRGRDDRGGGGGQAPPGVCRDFFNTGNCRFGDNCKFKHTQGDQGGRGYGGGGRGRGGPEPAFHKEIQTSKIAPGQPVPIQANFHKMGFANSNRLYVYRVEFGAGIDIRSSRETGKAYRNVKNELAATFGLFQCDLTTLISTTLVENEVTLNTKGTEMRIIFKLMIDLDELSAEAKPYMPEVLTIFNKIVKASLKLKKYEQVGRLPKFFNADEKIDIPRFKLVAWPGYEVKTVLTTQGVFFNVESCTKFVNQVTVYQLYNEHMNDGYNK